MLVLQALKMIKGGFRPKGEFTWPRDRPVTGARIEFRYGEAWYPGAYDDGKDWPAPVWLTAAGAVLEGTDAVACSVAKRWRPHLGAN